MILTDWDTGKPVPVDVESILKLVPHVNGGTVVFVRRLGPNLAYRHVVESLANIWTLIKS